MGRAQARAAERARGGESRGLRGLQPRVPRAGAGAGRVEETSLLTSLKCKVSVHRIGTDCRVATEAFPRWRSGMVSDRRILRPARSPARFGWEHAAVGDPHHVPVSPEWHAAEDEHVRGGRGNSGAPRDFNLED